MRTTEATVAAAAAEVDMWHARLDIAQADFTRMQALRTDGVVSQQQFDTADSARKSAQAQRRESTPPDPSPGGAGWRPGESSDRGN